MQRVAEPHPVQCVAESSGRDPPDHALHGTDHAVEAAVLLEPAADPQEFRRPARPPEPYRPYQAPEA
jgi:hypothetical protein